MSYDDGSVIIGRIVGNEIEYLSDDGPPYEFSNEDTAVSWLVQAGYTPDEWMIRHSIGTCCRCGSNLYPSDIPEYHSQCFVCDEDFYEFEQETDDGEIICEVKIDDCN